MGVWFDWRLFWLCTVCSFLLAACRNLHLSSHDKVKFKGNFSLRVIKLLFNYYFSSCDVVVCSDGALGRPLCLSEGSGGETCCKGHIKTTWSSSITRAERGPSWISDPGSVMKFRVLIKELKSERSDIFAEVPRLNNNAREVASVA